MNKKIFVRENVLIIAGIISSILLLILMQAFVLSKGMFAISADEAGHTLEAYSWFKGEAEVFSIWLPFQKVLYGLFFHLHYDLIWVPRIISSIFGIATLTALIFLSLELFKDKTSAVLTGLLASLFWGVVIFSVLPLTEIYSILFIISSLFFLIRWMNNKSSIALWLAAGLSGIGTTVRYENWLFSVIIFLVIVYFIWKMDEKPQKIITKIIGISIILFLFPIYWMYLSLATTGDVFGFLHSVADRYILRDTAPGISDNLLFNFFEINFLTLNVIGIISIVILYNRNTKLKLYSVILFSTLLIMASATYLSNAMPTHNSWRLVSVWSIMLIPLTAFFIKHFLKSEKKYFRYLYIVCLIVIMYLFFQRIEFYSDQRYMTWSDIETGDYINKEILSKNTDAKIFIERNIWEYSNILIASQLPDRFIVEAENSTNMLKLPYYDAVKIDSLRKLDVKFVMLKPTNVDYFDPAKLILLKQFSNWKIYRLN